MKNTDLIGDIHGHAEKLEALLLKLNYHKKNGAYTHPERKVLFLGDYIDRGPKIRETLQIVRSMVDSGNAIALMGNHEYNAICFHLQEREGGHVRKHSIQNIIQHFETLKQFQNLEKEYDDYIDWFKTLPLFYEGNEFRAVHACWDKQNIDLLKNILVNNRLNDELIYQATEKGSALYHAVEETLKGKEIKIPAGLTFTDKDGHVRSEIRIKWWEDPSRVTYKSYSIVPLESLPDEPISSSHQFSFYGPTEKPVFFGHYWLKGDPFFYRPNVCCLDYSVAKGGHLVAYRLGEEKELIKENLLVV